MHIFSNSLLAKLFSPIILVFLLALVVVSIFISQQIRSNAIESALPGALSTVQQYKTIRAYYTKNVVQKALANSNLRPHFEHKNSAEHIPLPATFIHDLSEEFARQGMHIKLYSEHPFPNRAARRLDDFARDAWRALNRDSDSSFSRIDSVDGQQVLRVAVADTMSAQGCVDCHNSHPDTPQRGWKLGDVRGVLEVQVPIGAQLAAGQSMNRELIALLVLMLLILLVSTYFLFRTFVSRRLERVSSSLNTIADGNGGLNQRIVFQSNDELAEIAHAFNRFVSRLELSMNEVDSEMRHLQQTSTTLQQVADDSEQCSSAQLAETDQVATAMHELNATAQEVARLAGHTAEHTATAQKQAQSGQKIVEDSQQAVLGLSQKMQTAAQTVSELEEHSQNIGSVLDVIRGIAEQTNLLALNAAIEAARAGEQGRGFAVVADEVRTLASKTQASTEEINSMIAQLQNGTGEAVSAIEQSNESLQRSLELSASISGAITTMVESSSEVANLNTQIATAAEEQTSVSEEINANISNISDLAAKTNESVQALKDSSGQIGKAVNAVTSQLQSFSQD
ncbi:methyl-accepting chemotaxis protein [Agaribacterium haliotis]|uniref:methyl-accepting chemotaxis protein n=1 Tax=Agaribacterium haliotis TaxID=2013869 RepID=UPI000BB53355|nr:methyl-accepting chemotaxis protein [Agaribacterium haliotis]